MILECINCGSRSSKSLERGYCKKCEDKAPSRELVAKAIEALREANAQRAACERIPAIVTTSASGMTEEWRPAPGHIMTKRYVRLARYPDGSTWFEGSDTPFISPEERLFGGRA